MTPARITFTFLPNQKVPKQQCDDPARGSKSIAEKVTGAHDPGARRRSSRRRGSRGTRGRRAGDAAGRRPSRATTADDLRQEAMTDPAVQALFEIFPVEKSKIEEI